MADFETAVNHVLGQEGGYSDHAADRGGKTRFGITEPVARRHDYTGDMADFPREQAVEIYRSSYWEPIRGDDLPEVLGTRMLDFAVNAGPSTAVRALQRALDVTDDGLIGLQTLAALAKADAIGMMLIEARVRLNQIRHYRDIVMRDRSQAVFLLGWLNRALT